MSLWYSWRHLLVLFLRHFILFPSQHGTLGTIEFFALHLSCRRSGREILQDLTSANDMGVQCAPEVHILPSTGPSDPVPQNSCILVRHDYARLWHITGFLQSAVVISVVDTSAITACIHQGLQWFISQAFYHSHDCQFSTVSEPADDPRSSEAGFLLP
ncbi:hypothetical protein C8R44DRAFT_260348 [Mycena epipterygia]|nr:hypothetical protein C8R44DRAFT_260348 [Mycena epipterygia]